MGITDRRTGASYDDVLFQHVKSDAQPTLQGASGYFSTPTNSLDPRLFDGMHFKPEVRRWIMTMLYRFWERKYGAPQQWSTVWIAGSGITYQWSAGRESGGAPGDLDTLVGVNFPEFFRRNPRYAGIGEGAMADVFNDQFRKELDPLTAHATLPAGGAFEVTFYVNPGAADIRAINPYAAYNLTDDEWTVPPIELPANWGPQQFGKEWWDVIHREHSEAAMHLAYYRTLRTQALQEAQDSPQWLNTMTQLHDTLEQSKRLFDSIHEERHRAFSTDGNGYLDFYNFRWQAHKRDGTVPAMHALASIYSAAHKDRNEQCYNGRVLDSRHALTVAALTANGVI